MGQELDKADLAPLTEEEEVCWQEFAKSWGPSPETLAGQTSTDGLQVDFNFGARVKVSEGKWRVRYIDRDNCTILLDREASNEVVICPRVYYINYRVDVWREGELVWSHDLSLQGQRVMICSLSNALGDNIAWVAYADAFRKEHNCEVWYVVPEHLVQMLQRNYPDLHIITREQRPARTYAAYYIGTIVHAGRAIAPVDWRIVGMQQVAAYILGLPPERLATRLVPKDTTRRIAEPYVCIAAQSTAQAKYWNNPVGWYETVKFLKAKGYRVLCIDREYCYGKGWQQNMIPYGTEDFTGNKPLEERLELLYHADFFLGLSSGLSWLAWASGIPVIMISGFSLPLMEFDTPYRIINYHVCNSCFTDSSLEFDRKNFEWCPRLSGTERQFECTRLIRSSRVTKEIERLMKNEGLLPKTGEIGGK